MPKPSASNRQGLHLVRTSNRPALTPILLAQYQTLSVSMRGAAQLRASGYPLLPRQELFHARARYASFCQTETILSEALATITPPDLQEIVLAVRQTTQIAKEHFVSLYDREIPLRQYSLRMAAILDWHLLAGLHNALVLTSTAQLANEHPEDRATWQSLSQAFHITGSLPSDNLLRICWLLLFYWPFQKSRPFSQYIADFRDSGSQDLPIDSFR